MCATHDWSLFLSPFSPSSSYLSFSSSLQPWKTLTKVSKETLRRCIKIDDLRFDDLHEITTFSLPLSLLRGHALDSWSFIVHLRCLSLSLSCHIFATITGRVHRPLRKLRTHSITHRPANHFKTSSIDDETRDRAPKGEPWKWRRKKISCEKNRGHTHTQTRLFGYCLKVHCA